MSKLVCLFALLFVSLSLAQKEDRPCYALAFSAGADKGAYQAGVI